MLAKIAAKTVERWPEACPDRARVDKLLQQAASFNHWQENAPVEVRRTNLTAGRRSESTVLRRRRPSRFPRSQHRFRLSSRPNIENWGFANPETGKPYWPGRVQENWLFPAAKKLGIGRIAWHTFRRSHSTLLHALGVDLKVQQELLRHADVRTTLNIYTAAVPSALREANSKVVRLVIPAQVA
jgi:hypothetical protein